jgi:hypothetical protein
VTVATAVVAVGGVVAAGVVDAVALGVVAAPDACPVSTAMTGGVRFAATVVEVGGVVDVVGPVDVALLKSERAELNGPLLAATPACGRVVGVLVVDTIAMTTPAMRSAIEHESAATTHIGGRRR